MLAQVLFGGLAVGSIYGLVALGFAVVFKATDVFNFAQGMFVVCGAFFAVTAVSILKLPFGVAILFIIGASALLGVVIHMLLIQPLSGRPMLSVIMLTIALSIVMRALIEMFYGSQGRPLNTALPTGVFVVGDLRMSQLHLTAMVVSWVCMAAFGAFFKFTPVGLLMRATADGHEAAVVSGINVNVMNRLAWAIGSVLAAIGGLFLGQLQIVSTEPVGLTVRILGATGRHARGFITAGATGTPRGTDFRKEFPVGKELDAKIIEIDPKRGELKLSIKAMNEDTERNAYQQYRAQVKREAKFGTLADLLQKRNIVPQK